MTKNEVAKSLVVLLANNTNFRVHFQVLKDNKSLFF